MKKVSTHSNATNIEDLVNNAFSNDNNVKQLTEKRFNIPKKFIFIALLSLVGIVSITTVAYAFTKISTYSQSTKDTTPIIATVQPAVCEPQAESTVTSDDTRENSIVKPRSRVQHAVQQPSSPSPNPQTIVINNNPQAKAVVVNHVPATQTSSTPQPETTSEPQPSSEPESQPAIVIEVPELPLPLPTLPPIQIPLPL